MAKIALILLLVVSSWSSIFDTKCEKCHTRRGAPLRKIFFDYLLHYSSERLIKEAMKEQLLHPNPKKSPLHQKNSYKHTIDPNEIDILLQIYWNRYKVIGKIR